MSVIHDQQDNEALLADSGVQHAAEDQAFHLEQERAASPPWSSWQNIPLRAQQDMSDTPGSPTSAEDWEVLNAASSSSHGSSSRFMHAEDEDEQASATELPQLHITLTPQGSSAITMLLEPISNDSSPRQPADAIQQQFQQQLRKAQETLLPEFNIHHTIRPQGITQQPEEVAAEALPTSIHLPMQADTSNSSPEGSDADAAPSHDTAADNAVTQPMSAEEHVSAPSMCELEAAQTGAQDDTDGQVELKSWEETARDEFASNASAVSEEEAGVHGNSVGQASVMSDGSFVDVSAEEAEGITAAVTDLDVDSPTEGQSPAIELARLSDSSDSVRAGYLELSEQTKEVLGLLQDEAEESQEAGQTEHVADTEDALHDDQEVPSECVDEEEEFDKYSSWSSVTMASIRRRLSQVLSTLQAWGSSAYSCLPAFPSSDGSSYHKLGGKPVGLDWLHFFFAGSLTLASAALSYYVMRNRELTRRLALSNAELSKVLFKVINLQQYVQNPGRVPIIRHTSSVSALSTFPLTHLM